MQQVPGIDQETLITIRRRKRMKTIRLSVTHKGIVVSAPYWVSKREIHCFVHAKKRWISRQRVRLGALELKREAFFEHNPELSKRIIEQKLTSRVRSLASSFGFSYQKITIRNQKTRWGSCSSRGTISLNRNLAYLPPNLLDYVILHELMHTRIKDHGAAYWRELALCVANPRSLDKDLSSYEFFIE